MDLTVVDNKADMERLAKEYGFVPMEDILHDEPEEKAFEVRDVSAAAWASERVLTANDRLAAAKDYVKIAKQRLDDWLAGIEAETRSTDEFFLPHLRAYTDTQLDGKKRSIVLPNGVKLGFRKLQSVLNLPDDIDSVVQALEDQGYTDAVRIKKEVDKKELRKLVQSGTEVPGVTLIEQADRFYVEEPKG
jgi:phage host-nuclease inhibitor protein Gam